MDERGYSAGAFLSGLMLLPLSDVISLSIESGANIVCMGDSASSEWICARYQ